MSDTTYKVKYVIDVDATRGTENLRDFAKLVGQIANVKANFGDATTGVAQFAKQMDQVFRPNGKKKDFNYKFNIETGQTIANLTSVKKLLTEINDLARTTGTALKATESLKGRTARKETKPAPDTLPLDPTTLRQLKAANKKSANRSVNSFNQQKKKLVTDINAVDRSIAKLEKPREVNIQTAKAEERLNRLLGTLNQINEVSRNLKLGNIDRIRNSAVKSSNAKAPYLLPQPMNDRLMNRLYYNDELNNQRIANLRRRGDTELRNRTLLADLDRKEWLHKRKYTEEYANRIRAEREQRNARLAASAANRKRADDAIKNARSVVKDHGSNRQRIQQQAITRLQYTKPPSFRDMPGAYMFNGYMAYSMLKNETVKAVEYANIMESARNILRVSDNDLSNFENRFDQMAKYVRQIGIETKFSAIEVAGAVKYLSMAGMDIQTINESIRPITNLALIGDNDVAEIADLATNIMSGYSIKSSSMGSVADILASTVSRSNVNIIEMAESFKMSAGFLKIAGIEFSEASALIGILGNQGMKGTISGTGLRQISSRLARQPKRAKETLKKLGVEFTEVIDVFGKQTERIRPFADIFADLNKKGATLPDLINIFGLIGGNAASLLIQNHEKVRALTLQNLASHGLSDELGKKKQETTKGLWYQVTSQFTEGFMKSFEVLEPQIQTLLRDFLAKFKADEFRKGIVTIGSALLGLFEILSNIATWFVKNYNWIEPILISGFVTSKLFKLAGAISNVGVALGFLGKQSAAGAALQSIGAIAGLPVGLGGFGALTGKMAFSDRRNLVKQLRSAGIVGKGVMAKLADNFVMGPRQGVSQLFAQRVTTGGGLVGAAGSLLALGKTAFAVTGYMTALAGAIGYVAYKVWQVEKAKRAILEKVSESQKYVFPSIEALKASLGEAYEQARKTKHAVEDLHSKSLAEAGGPITSRSAHTWLERIISGISADVKNPSIQYQGSYQEDVRRSILNIAKIDGAQSIASAWSELAKLRNLDQIKAFILNAKEAYRIKDEYLDASLYDIVNGKIEYKEGIENKSALSATQTPTYQSYFNKTVVDTIEENAQMYHDAIATVEGAREFLVSNRVKLDDIEELGFTRDKNGWLVQKALSANATQDERLAYINNFQNFSGRITDFIKTARNYFGGHIEPVIHILEKFGIGKKIYNNEPEDREYKENPTGITNDDDGGAGGNYSGTGKLHAAAPKQVIVNIQSLMSMDTIQLLQSENGNIAEIQNLKEQMAQALIDVVHDFDASWNG